MVEMRGLEPLTSCMRSNTSELPNLLSLLEAIDFTVYPFGKFFLFLQVLAYSGTIFTHGFTHKKCPFCVGSELREYSFLRE
jgi:hypothetical protein